jgi:uncharacterized protein
MTKDGKPTVVIDTNLLISAIISKNTTPPYNLLTAWRKKKFFLVLSDGLLAEIDEVFKREKIFIAYHVSLNTRELLIKELKNSAFIATPIKSEALPIHSRDKKDDKLLMCALGGDCDYLITGDEDLLVLKGRPELGKLKIVKVAEFLQLI